jgi:hypothetical protein
MTQFLAKEGSAMKSRSLSILAVLCAASLANAAGFQSNENFLVFTESMLSRTASQEFAEAVLTQAEQYRKQIALEWFGEELPLGVGRTTINVTFSADKDDAGAWVKNNPNQKLNTIYLHTSAENALGATLAHEIAHIVLATEFPAPQRLPAWLEEGIASRYDGQQRRQTRDSMMRWFRKGHWPRVEPVLDANNIGAKDTESYTVAVTLTEMLLDRGGNKKLLEFGETINRVGWARAVEQHYQIRDVEELQRLWQSWVSRSDRLAANNR